MVTSKIKGIYKGFKHITQIFVVKDRELEIGCPTDVKHVAHIGWDGTTGNSPSWMTGFKTVPELSVAKPCGGCANNTIGIPRDSNSTMFFTPWSSQDFNEPKVRHPLPEACTLDGIVPISDPSSKPKKQKRKKKTRPSTTKGSSTSSLVPKPVRSSNTKSGLHELEATMTVLA